MSKEYNEYILLKSEFPGRLSVEEAAIEDAERKGLKVLKNTKDKLGLAKLLFSEANEEFSKGNEKEALEKLRKANNSILDASRDVDELNFMDLFEKASKAYASFKGYEDLALKHIKNYREHTEKFIEIEKHVEEYKSSGEGTLRFFISSYTEKLQAFLDDFETDEKVLFAAIEKERRIHKLEDETVRQGREIVSLSEKSVQLEEKNSRRWIIQIIVDIFAGGGAVVWLFNHFIGN